MTTFDIDSNRALFQIKAYQPGSIQINDIIYTKSVIITPNQLIDHWEVTSTHELSAEKFSLILPLKPDILLIGTGSQMVLLPLEIYGALINHGIGVEIMSTSAACRTFNALSAEERNVVAALIA